MDLQTGDSDLYSDFAASNFEKFSIDIFVSFFTMINELNSCNGPKIKNVKNTMVNKSPTIILSPNKK